MKSSPLHVWIIRCCLSPLGSALKRFRQVPFSFLSHSQTLCDFSVCQSPYRPLSINGQRELAPSALFWLPFSWLPSFLSWRCWSLVLPHLCDLCCLACALTVWFIVFPGENVPGLHSCSSLTNQDIALKSQTKLPQTHSSSSRWYLVCDLTSKACLKIKVWS